MKCKATTLMHALYDGYVHEMGMEKRAAAILAYTSVINAAKQGHGGSKFALHKPEWYEQPYRAKWIRAEFNGRNVTDLANKYGVNRSTVYRITRLNEDFDVCHDDPLDAFMADVGASVA